MARRRMVNVEIWDTAFERNWDMNVVGVFVAFITNADDSGRGRVGAVGRSVACTMVGNVDWREIVWRLHDENSVMVYDDKYYVLPGWSAEQKLRHAIPSKLPEPPKIKQKTFQNFQKKSKESRKNSADSGKTPKTPPILGENPKNSAKSYPQSDVDNKTPHSLISLSTTTTTRSSSTRLKEVSLNKSSVNSGKTPETPGGPVSPENLKLSDRKLKIRKVVNRFNNPIQPHHEKIVQAIFGEFPHHTELLVRAHLRDSYQKDRPKGWIVNALTELWTPSEPSMEIAKAEMQIDLGSLPPEIQEEVGKIGKKVKNG